VGFYKTEEQVCCGNPFFYVVATRCHDSSLAIDIGVMDEDDQDRYTKSLYFRTREEWLRAFNFIVCELYDKRYLRTNDLWEAFDTYIKPLEEYLSAS
jgi:hypothetical protein